VWRISRPEGRCHRSSLVIEAPEAADHVVETLHVVAEVVVVADIAEDDLRAEVMGIARQRDVGFDAFERPVSEEPVHLVHGGNEAVCADHLDRTRSLKPRDADRAAVDEDVALVEHGVASLVLELSGC
jgi:hypothetical protein